MSASCPRLQGHNLKRKGLSYTMIGSEAHKIAHDQSEPELARNIKEIMLI